MDLNKERKKGRKKERKRKRMKEKQRKREKGKKKERGFYTRNPLVVSCFLK